MSEFDLVSSKAVKSEIRLLITSLLCPVIITAIYLGLVAALFSALLFFALGLGVGAYTIARVLSFIPLPAALPSVQRFWFYFVPLMGLYFYVGWNLQL